MNRITGSTRVLTVLGDPVAHSLSPTMHNAAISMLGLDAVYVAIRATASAFPHVLRGLGAAGIGGNITIPHKVAAADLIGRLTDRAKELGAVNTFWVEDDRLVGDNTDVAGVVGALQHLRAGGPWLLIGTGGSARAVVAAARETGTTIIVQSRDSGRAADFVRWSRERGADAVADDDRPVAAAINTTPLGMRDEDALPVRHERLEDCEVVQDLVYRPGRTRWVRESEERGCRAADGRVVLVEQGVHAFRRFFPDVVPPRAVMAAAVNRMLDR